MNFRTTDKNIDPKTNTALFTEPTTLFVQDRDIIVVHTVNASQLGRPDLISLYYYDTHDYTDIILKFNGISNPFSLNIGDTLEIPIQQTAFGKFIKPTRTGGDSAKDKFIKQRHMTPKDIKRLDYLQKVSQDGALPPNRLKTGQVNKTADSGIITDLNPSQFR
tara:strand:+ start:60 stop:548 length:489 start_codon:yes stop_codon:yes gene_type:complete